MTPFQVGGDIEELIRNTLAAPALKVLDKTEFTQ